MTDVIIMNFGSVKLTHDFRQKGIAAGFLSADIMNSRARAEIVSLLNDASDPKRSRNRIREDHKTAANDALHTFEELAATVWRSDPVGNKNYHVRFREWQIELCKSPVSCVYLAGHHVDGYNYGIKEDKGIYAYYFHELGKVDAKPQIIYMDSSGQSQAVVPADTLLKDCAVIFGFGCNIANKVNATRYQLWVEKASGKRPVILGFRTSMSAPRANFTINLFTEFYNVLKELTDTYTSTPVHARIRKLYDDNPSGFLALWGKALLPFYANHPRSKGCPADQRIRMNSLWKSATAVLPDGKAYGFNAVYVDNDWKAAPVLL